MGTDNVLDFMPTHFTQAVKAEVEKRIRLAQKVFPHWQTGVSGFAEHVAGKVSKSRIKKFECAVNKAIFEKEGHPGDVKDIIASRVLFHDHDHLLDFMDKSAHEGTVLFRMNSEPIIVTKVTNGFDGHQDEEMRGTRQLKLVVSVPVQTKNIIDRIPAEIQIRSAFTQAVYDSTHPSYRRYQKLGQDSHVIENDPKIRPIARLRILQRMASEARELAQTITDVHQTANEEYGLNEFRDNLLARGSRPARAFQSL
jgi:ppGpp synthetase/RelA/SpoT-type nucleotidyltranferase